MPRMMIRVDIENAYECQEWPVVLATLRKMNFLDIWIDWIRVCLTSSSFFFINDQSSKWIKSSRGRVRQGDPISPYLFILVSQNLSNILNFAMERYYISRFDNRLRVNFNHLLFADDLTIITKASRAVAKSYLLGLDIFGDLIGQKPNPKKSVIYFTTWLNKTICKSISQILNMQFGKFLFNYLWATISPNRLPLSTFQGLINRGNKAIRSWSHLPLSYAGKAILINSFLLTIPNYALSYYLVPIIILDNFNKMARKFFWTRGNNGRGLHSIA